MNEWYEYSEIQIKNTFNLFSGSNLIKDFWTWKTITSKVVHFTKDYAKDFFNKEFFDDKKIDMIVIYYPH